MKRKLTVAGVCLGTILVAVLGFASRGSRPVHTRHVQITFASDGKPVFQPYDTRETCIMIVGASGLTNYPSFPTNLPKSK